MNKGNFGYVLLGLLKKAQKEKEHVSRVVKKDVKEHGNAQLQILNAKIEKTEKKLKEVQEEVRKEEVRKENIENLISERTLNTKDFLQKFAECKTQRDDIQHELNKINITLSKLNEQDKDQKKNIKKLEDDGKEHEKKINDQKEELLLIAEKLKNEIKKYNIIVESYTSQKKLILDYEKLFNELMKHELTEHELTEYEHGLQNTRDFTDIEKLIEENERLIEENKRLIEERLKHENDGAQISDLEKENKILSDDILRYVEDNTKIERINKEKIEEIKALREELEALKEELREVLEELREVLRDRINKEKIIKDKNTTYSRTIERLVAELKDLNEAFDKQINTQKKIEDERNILGRENLEFRETIERLEKSLETEINHRNMIEESNMMLGKEITEFRETIEKQKEESERRSVLESKCFINVDDIAAFNVIIGELMEHSQKKINLPHEFTKTLAEFTQSRLKKIMTNEDDGFRKFLRENQIDEEGMSQVLINLSPSMEEKEDEEEI